MSQKQLTIRGFDKELELRLLARKKEISLDKAALFLMRGAGLQKDSRPVVIGQSLDHLMGRWSDHEASEFAEATRGFDVIDEELWA